MGASTEARRNGQPNRVTLERFIDRSRAVHGDEYDYSFVEFVNTKTKVRIICREHGEFFQTPEKHMAGGGCPHKDCIAKRKRITCLKKYGVEHQSQAESVKKQKKQTMVARYGAENAMHVPAFKQKHDDTCMAIYGASSPLGNNEVRSKIIHTMHEVHGGAGAMCDSAVREKSIATNLAKRGVENVMQDEVVKKAVADTMEKRYGARNAMQVSSFRLKQRESQKETMLERYGADSGFGSSVLREKAQDTCVAKYGVPNVMLAKLFVDKMTASKITNGTTNTSEPENLLYDQLCEVFGSEDVVRQYVSSEYPYACDFYVKSRNMFIELNANWSHGPCWFEDRNDDSLLDKIREKSVSSEFYKTALHVWSVADVAKRAAARNGNLNYVVFWDSKLRDVELWFSMGMPDGHDYDCMYSWLPENLVWSAPRMVLTGTYQNLSRVVKHYQMGVFYNREHGLWVTNDVYRETFLRIWLYHNRLRYLGKTPDQLSALEIARGFTISGILKGYTVFDTTLMDAVVQKYGIISVYDPCSGWGERALYCKSHGDLRYLGVDINGKLFSGYEAMRSDFSMDKQHFLHQDSAQVVLSGTYQAVVTCPPYGNTEIYSPDGAENLSEQDFIQWWDSVVQNSLQVQPEYFCFQVNTRWRDSMLAAVLDNGFVLLEEFAYQKHSSSHFTRKNGQDVKSSKETMLVCRRVS